MRVTRELRARIKEAFDAAGIEIPFTQRTVWHRSGDSTGAVAVIPRTGE
ncbi:MAG: mechanosensitive ion channel family protein [Actinomycetota bacterium]|nr:mechanosensitive ion channel family protein [Actinomycetota bacterium]